MLCFDRFTGSLNLITDKQINTNPQQNKAFIHVGFLLLDIWPKIIHSNLTRSSVNLHLFWELKGVFKSILETQITFHIMTRIVQSLYTDPFVKKEFLKNDIYDTGTLFLYHPALERQNSTVKQGLWILLLLHSFLCFYSLDVAHPLAYSLLASLAGLTTHCLTPHFNEEDQAGILFLSPSNCSYILQQVAALVPKVLVYTFPSLLTSNLLFPLLPLTFSIYFYHSSLPEPTQFR